MPLNTLSVGPQIFSVLAGLIVLLGAGFAFAFRYAAAKQAGESGHKPPETEEEAQRVSPDGFIDTFAGIVDEAGGGVPFMASIIIAVTLVCYFVYLFLFWNPGR